MNKKNMLGMNMTEWRNLSGLADPYNLTEALTSKQLADLPEYEPGGGDLTHVVKVPKALQGKAANDRHQLRGDAIKAVAAARAERLAKAQKSIETHRKTFGGTTSTKLSDLSDKQQTRIMRKAAEKKSTNEDVTYGDVWGAYLEDRGSSVAEFDYLVNIAIESNDEEMAIELLAIEAQLDELLGKPMAGGGAPAGAVPPAGAPPAAPVGATPMAKPAMPAQAAVPAVAPTTAPTTKPMAPGAQVAGGAPAAPAAAPAAPKVGLLGKVASAVKGAGKVVGGMAQAALPAQNQSIDYADDFEAYLGEEHGLTAAQYIAICEHAFATNDVEMINYLHQMDEGVLDRFTRGGREKMAAKAKESRAAMAKTVSDAAVTINTHGRGAVSRDARSGSASPMPGKAAPKQPNLMLKGSGTTLNTSMESLISKQLQYSGYTDEYIDAKGRN